MDNVLVVGNGWLGTRIVEELGYTMARKVRFSTMNNNVSDGDLPIFMDDLEQYVNLGITHVGDTNGYVSINECLDRVRFKEMKKIKKDDFVGL